MNKTTEPPKDKIEAYQKLIDGMEKIELKGKTMPYTSINGHMFSFLDKAGQMGLRLSKEDREKFLIDHQTTLCEQYGAIMKEYVAVPESLLLKPKALKPYLEKSLKYVSHLKPKPTKK